MRQVKKDDVPPVPAPASIKRIVGFLNSTSEPVSFMVESPGFSSRDDHRMSFGQNGRDEIKTVAD